MIKKVTNREVRELVRDGFEFKANNMFSEWVPHDGSNVYVVYSYGRHWPLFALVDGKWYANSSRYSVTTSKHYGQAHPGNPVIPLNVEQMKQLVNYGKVPQ